MNTIMIPSLAVLKVSSINMVPYQNAAECILLDIYAAWSGQMLMQAFFEETNEPCTFSAYKSLKITFISFNPHPSPPTSQSLVLFSMSLRPVSRMCYFYKGW